MHLTILQSYLIVHVFMQMNIPVLPSKYLHLKYLKISLAAYTFPSTFDYFSLASFFDACPSLEAFFLDVSLCSYLDVSSFFLHLN